MMHPPTLSQIDATRARIAPYVIETPTLAYYGLSMDRLLGPASDVWLKLELLQRTGTFKPRGAINVMIHLTPEEQAQGVIAMSAGNHAIATAYGAKALGLSAKVVMPKTANPYRVERCRDLGAELLFADNLEDLFSMVDRIQKDEGRALVHPFEGPRTFEGTATVGLELCRSLANIDAVIVPIGGGGLIAGIASAVKQLQPGCKVYGVEPAGAQGMRQSLQAGAPMAKVAVATIADSLGAPLHTPGAFSLVQQFVDDIVTVEDGAMVAAMGLMFTDLKLAVEPAAAAAMAALLGPLKTRLVGRRTALIVCGSNIDPATYARMTGLASYGR